MFLLFNKPNRTIKNIRNNIYLLTVSCLTGIFLISSKAIAIDIEEQINNEFKTFSCISYQKFTPEEYQKLSFSEGLGVNIPEAVNQLKECVKKQKIAEVDVAQNIGVAYTTRTYGDTFVILAIAGSKLTNLPIKNNPNPLKITTKNTTYQRLPGTTAAAPNNQLKIIIINGIEIDGLPYQQGNKITAKAIAQNNNQDLSAEINWYNLSGELIGTGPEITYELKKVGADTIQAIIKDAKNNETWDLVSFVVNPPGIQTAPNVKIINQEDISKRIITQDLQQGYLCLEDHPTLTTKIKPGDKLVLPNLPALRLGYEVEPNFIFNTNKYPQNTICFRTVEITNPGIIIRI